MLEGGRVTYMGRMALVSTHGCMQAREIGEAGARELARVLERNICITHIDVSVCSSSEGGWDGSRMALVHSYLHTV